MPSAWPMTGILVLFWILFTNSLPPLGMTRSIYRSWASRDEISDRVETDWMKVGGMDVEERASDMRLESNVAVCKDSLPPFKIAALPSISMVPGEDTAKKPTRLDSQCGNVDNHFRSSLKDHQQDPNGAGHPVKIQSWSNFLGESDDSCWRRQRLDVGDALHHRVVFPSSRQV